MYLFTFWDIAVMVLYVILPELTIYGKLERTLWVSLSYNECQSIFFYLTYLLTSVVRSAKIFLSLEFG